MRIGILTFNKVRNYGGMLQAYALQEYIKSLSDTYDVYHIVSKQPRIKMTPKNILLRLMRLPSIVRYKKFEKLINYYNGEYCDANAEELNNEFDVFISGSDQVWNVTNGLDGLFYQKFVTNAKKISYAASIGISSIPDALKADVKNALESFDSILVRENTAKQILSEILARKNIAQVLDPVFLLSREQWSRMCGERIEKKPYIFVYGTQMTAELKEAAYRLADLYNLNICSVFRMKHTKTLDYAIGPLEFVNYVKNAEFVVTTSFHCTAFSVIFEKKLIEILHSSTGSRASDLLEFFGIKEDCIYRSEKNFKDYSWEYKGLQEKLISATEQSKELLHESIIG